MNQQIINYINTQRIGVLAVEMLDGAPHGATVHFAHNDEPFSILIMTDRAYKKCEPLVKNGKARASFVIGQSEQDMKTLQMDGVLEFTEDEETAKLPYFTKFPEKKDKFEAPDDVILKFTPSWWRYTDYKAPKDERFITSE